MGRPFEVLHVSCFVDPLRRTCDELLDAWPTLTDFAGAAALSHVHGAVLQASSYDATTQRNGVTCHFTAERLGSRVRRRIGMWAAPLTHRLVWRARQLRPQLIHFHSLSFPRHLQLLRRALPEVPILVQDHADRPPPNWRRALHRRGLAGVGGVAFTALEQVRPFLDAGVLPPDVPVFEILETSSRFTPGNQDSARRETGLHGDPCLLWVADLIPRKDPLAVLDALSRCVDRLNDPQLWCCYQMAPLLKDVEERIVRDPTLAGRVHLLGRKSHSDVEHLLQAADFLIMGSHSEGSGFAVQEALACGTTPIITEIASFRKITGNGAVGSLTPPGNSVAMARAIVECSKRDRRELRQLARGHFERELSFEVLGRQLRSAYETLLRGR